MLKGIGYAICVIDIYVGMFYNTVIGWAVYYFVQAFLSAAQVNIMNCPNNSLIKVAHDSSPTLIKSILCPGHLVTIPGTQIQVVSFCLKFR